MMKFDFYGQCLQASGDRNGFNGILNQSTGFTVQLLAQPPQ